MKTLIALAIFAIVLTGCASSPRFSHVPDTAAPFIYFDQKTQQVCWAGIAAVYAPYMFPSDDTIHGKNLVNIIVDKDNAKLMAEMPLCRDLK